MKKLCALLIAGVVFAPFAFSAVTAYSPPVGGMTINIAAGSIAGPVTSSFALPLQDMPQASGLARGRIAAMSATTLTVTNAGWTSGALATAAFPYALRMTSGAASGYTFSITANTADTLTISGGNPTLLGIVTGSNGDSFRLIPVDTLNTLFGSATFTGGANADEADVVILSNTARLAYYYNTTLSRWVRTTGPTTDRGTTAIPLDSVVSVVRKQSAMVLRFTGAVPMERFNLVVPNAGSKYTHTGFPTDVTLGNLNLQSALQGWVSALQAADADTLSVVSGATTLSYFHNGTYWQRTTGPTTNRNAVVITAGTPIVLFKRGSASGSALLLRNLPY